MPSVTTQDLLDALDEGLLAVDGRGRISCVNGRARDLLGGGRLESRLLSRVLPGLEPSVRACLDSGETVAARPETPSGTVLEGTVAAVRQGERVTGAVFLFRPSGTSPDQAAGRPELQTVFDTSHDGLWIVDAQGVILNLNRAAEELNHIRAADVIGRRVHELVDQGFLDFSVSEKVLETGRPVSLMQRGLKSKRHLLVTGTPAFGPDGKIAFVVVNDRDLTELNQLTQELEQARLVNEKFRDELAERAIVETARGEVVADSEEMKQVLRVALKLARLDVSNILLLGESGTGKGLLAKFIHRNGPRAAKPFIHINCAALPENLLEAELFGYEKGAFTGAREHGKAGLFELAHEGTLFLDEIGDLPLAIQAKLLKYLDDHELLPLGGTKPRSVDCTVIAATNADLEASVRRKQFRHDLFYRLNSFTIRIPPLKERQGDAALLADRFVAKYNEIYRTHKRLSARALRWIQSYPFPGNVRELEGLVKNAIVMTEGDLLGELAEGGARAATGEEVEAGGLAASLADRERALLQEAAERCRTTREIAGYLGVSQPTVVRKLRKHGLRPLG
ncbi:MAG: sigma 54-interacting transcriptional regulator [Deltaproteobacteria bacterium]|nr:sigma 54-interacting transcriptional regulator [Deltaproteobacteria bacterium]